MERRKNMKFINMPLSEKEKRMVAECNQPKGMEEMTREEGGKIIDEILEGAKKYAPQYPPLTAYKITYSDGSTSSTNMATGVTLEDAKKYFIGQWFDLGIDDKEDMQQAIRVEAI